MTVLSKLLKPLYRYQLFWDLAAPLSRFYPVSNMMKLPSSIIVEPTNACNLRCPVCPTHFDMIRKRGFLKNDVLRAVVDDFKNIKKKPTIAFNFAGEPTLHKGLNEHIKYAHDHGHYTFVSTNVSFVNKEMSTKLIAAGLSGIHLCIDGFTKESQESYRVGSKFEVIKKNIEDFMAAKNELNASNPKVVIQTLLTSFSENEMKEIVNWAEELGVDSVNFKTLSMGTYTTDEMKRKYAFLLPNNAKYRRKVTTLQRSLCSQPIRGSVVYWNGELGLCCVDFDNKVKMSNVLDGGFIQAWRMKSNAEKRLGGFRKQYVMCKNCSLANADFMGLEISLSKKESYREFFIH